MINVNLQRTRVHNHVRFRELFDQGPPRPSNTWVGFGRVVSMPTTRHPSSDMHPSPGCQVIGIGALIPQSGRKVVMATGQAVF